MSMKFTPSSTTRRRVCRAALRSAGGPQTPLPVMRMAPYPRRLTVQSPSWIVPALAAEMVGLVWLML